MTAIYQSRHGSFSWCAQPSSTAGLTSSAPAQFETTSAGAAGGTTVVSTSLDSANDYAYVGNILECVSATNTANIGCRAMITAFSAATDTATCHAFPAQVSSGDVFRMYETNDGKIIATDGVVGGATIIAAGRTEADDYWNGTSEEGGYYIEVVSADNPAASEHPRITDFANATGTFTLSTALSGNVVTGDFYRAMKHPEVTGVAMIPIDRPDIQRATLVSGHGHEPAARGLRSGAGAVELLHRGPGASRAGEETDTHEALRCVFSPTEVSDCTVDAASSLTSITYDAGSPAVGEMFVTEHGDMLMCVADSGTAITPSPKLRTIPDEDTTLYGAMTYTPATLLQKALTCYSYIGNGIERILYGVVPTPTFSSSSGDYNKISIQLTATDHYEHVLDSTAAALERGWYPRLPSVDALRGRDMRLALWDGATVVELNCLGWTFDPGIETKRKTNQCAPNDCDGYEIINVAPKGTFKTRMDSTTKRILRDAEGKKSWQFMLSSGSAAGYPGIMGVWAYDVTFAGIPQMADDAGEIVIDVQYEINRNEAGIALGLPQFAVAFA